MQIRNKFILDRWHIILVLLLCLVFFLSPALVYSQIFTQQKQELIEDQLYLSSGRTEEELDFGERPNIEYTAVNFRDPFIPGIFPAEEKPKGIKEEKIEYKSKISEQFSLSVQGITWDSDKPLAIINNKVLKKGDVFLITDDKGESKEST